MVVVGWRMARTRVEGESGRIVFNLSRDILIPNPRRWR